MTPRPIRVRCPAKINLRLEIVGRRADGYHELRTLFQAIDLEDILEAHPSDTLRMEADDPLLSVGEDNLVLRAARGLAGILGVARPTGRLVLRKRIPIGGGLGGGSSDAAGALAALSRLWGRSPSPDALADVAGRIGSDVPFFLRGGTAYGWGRGERVVPMPSFPGTPLLLGIPPFGIETAEVYRRFDAARDRAPAEPLPEALTPPEGGVTVPALFHKLAQKKDFALVRNDLEPVVLDGWPALGAFREALAERGAAAACVSGSGSTVFGVFESEGEAERAAAALRERFARWSLVVTRTVSNGVHVEGSDRGDAAGSGG